MNMDPESVFTRNEVLAYLAAAMFLFSLVGMAAVFLGEVIRNAAESSRCRTKKLDGQRGP